MNAHPETMAQGGVLKIKKNYFKEYSAYWIVFAFTCVWSIGGQWMDPALLRWAFVSCMVLFFLYHLFTKKSLGLMATAFFVLLSIIPSVILSQDKYYSVAQFGRFLAIILFIVSVASSDRSVKFYSIKGFLNAFCFLILLSTFVYPFLKDYLMGSAGTRIRYNGLFYHPNLTGFAAGIAILYSLNALFFIKSKIYKKIVYMLQIVCSIFMLLNSDSRSAMVCVFVASLVLFSQYLKKYSRPVVVGLSIASIAASFYPLFSVLFLTQKYDIFDNGSGNSLVVRQYAWRAAVENFLQNPVFGKGYGLEINTHAESYDSTFVILPYAHNIILNSIYWCGVFGLIYVGFIFYNVVINSLKVRYGRDYNAYFMYAIVIYTFCWALFDGSLQALWVTHLTFWLAICWFQRDPKPKQAEA